MAQPLTRRDKSGNLYKRQAAIEALLDKLLAMDRQTVERKAAIGDRASPDYVPDECFVHLIRKRHREANAPGRDQLLNLLFARCARNLASSVRDGSIPNAAEIRDEVLGRLGELFAEDGTGDNPDRLDFFEVRFAAALKALRIDVIREASRSAARTVPLPAEDEAGESISDDEAIARLPSAVLRNPASQEDRVFLMELFTALRALPPEVRKAVMLCEVWGYDVESEDPKKITAATLCGVSGRTIRARLKRAQLILKRFKEQK